MQGQFVDQPCGRLTIYFLPFFAGFFLAAGFAAAFFAGAFFVAMCLPSSFPRNIGWIVVAVAGVLQLSNLI